MNIAPANNNNNLYGPEAPAKPPLPNLVPPRELERVLLRMPAELVSSLDMIEVPLVVVRNTPGLYFVTTGFPELERVTEYLVYVPDQKAYPGRPEAPHNVREGMNAALAAMALAPQNVRNAFLAHRRERLEAIEANPALAFEARPEPLNVLILAQRYITMLNPPETAEQKLERFLKSAPAARNTPMARHMMETIYRPSAEESRRRYTDERKWRKSDGARTAASLTNFPDLVNARFFKADVAFGRRKHAVAAWGNARGLFNSRRRRASTRREGTRRRRSSHRR